MLAASLVLTASCFAAAIIKPIASASPSLIILPETARTQEPRETQPLILPPSVAAAASAALVTPGGAPLQAPAGQNLIKPATQEDLARLTSSLSKPAEQAPRLQAAFDGAHAPSDSAWEDVHRPNVYFAGGPRAPELPTIESTARSLFQRLLPRLYRPIPVKTVPVPPEKTGPGASHFWTAEEGHVIEVAPAEPDHRGLVQSVIGADETSGAPGPTVQQKIELLVQYLHEFSHALFDSAVRQEENHQVHSAHTAMTEGFAVTMERLLIEGILNNAPALGLSPHDAIDLRNIDAARRRWLKEEDNAYTEGQPIWRRAYETGGEDAVMSLLSSLSAHRLIDVPRADPAFQLALGNNDLLSAYLGNDSMNESRVGLEAFGKAARGEALLPEEEALASQAVRAAGKLARRRVFDRTLRRAVLMPGWDGPGWITPSWLRGSDSVAPAFALADLDETARAELAAYLGEAARAPNGLDHIFERPGPSQRLIDVVSRAEKLAWQPSDKVAWDAAITAWLTKGVRP